MSKPYQQHDPDHADIGKAEPHPKRPTSYTYRGGYRGRHDHSPKKIAGNLYECKRCKQPIMQNENSAWVLRK